MSFDSSPTSPHSSGKEQHKEKYDGIHEHVRSGSAYHVEVQSGSTGRRSHTPVLLNTNNESSPRLSGYYDNGLLNNLHNHGADQMISNTDLHLIRTFALATSTDQFSPNGCADGSSPIGHENGTTFENHESILGHQTGAYDLSSAYIHMSDYTTHYADQESSVNASMLNNVGHTPITYSQTAPYSRNTRPHSENLHSPADSLPYRLIFHPTNNGLPEFSVAEVSSGKTLGPVDVTQAFEAYLNSSLAMNTVTVSTPPMHQSHQGLPLTSTANLRIDR